MHIESRSANHLEACSCWQFCMGDMEVNPLSIILVKSDSKGDRLLFRYPYRVESTEVQCQNKRRNPYSIPAQEDILQSPPPQTSNIHQGKRDYLHFAISMNWI